MQINFVKFSFSKNFMTLHIFSCHNTLNHQFSYGKHSFLNEEKSYMNLHSVFFHACHHISYHLLFFTVYYFLWIILCWLVCLKIRTGKPIFSTFSRVFLTFFKPSITAEKCPKTELSLVRIVLHSHWIWRFTEYGDLQSKSPYSAWMQENKDQK